MRVSRGVEPSFFDLCGRGIRCRGAAAVVLPKAEPGQLNAAGVPGITEFTFDYFVKTAGLSLQKVPYRDIVQAATDVGEGRLQIYMASYAILQPQAEAGRIRTLVVTGRQRAPTLPDIPTAIEAGFPALEVEGLVGLFGIYRPMIAIVCAHG